MQELYLNICDELDKLYDKLEEDNQNINTNYINGEIHAYQCLSQ